MPARMPAAEVDIDEDLVRRLLAAQFPQWAGLPLSPAAAIGWDNAIYRLGPDLAVRLPRRQLAAELTETEQRWLPDLAGRLPVAIPVPIGKGVPGEGYPWRWTVCPWIDGEIAAAVPIGDPACDLVSAWMLLPPPSRTVLRGGTGVDDHTWARGRGWALTMSLAVLASSADNPILAAVGRRGLDAVLADT